MIAIQIKPSPLLIRAAAILQLWYAHQCVTYHEYRTRQALAGKVDARNRGTLDKHGAYFEEMIAESAAELAEAHKDVARLKSDLLRATP